MDKTRLELEIFVDSAWLRVAEIHCAEQNKGYLSQMTLAYFEDYVEKHLLINDYRALSCRYPINYTFHRENTWAPFLLDIMPSGAARRYWLAKLELPNNANSDWELLSQGSTNAPGNIRVKSRLEQFQFSENIKHNGFNTSEIIEKNENFINYALECGAPVTGSSGAHGDAPKFLLTQDYHDMWHADGALADKDAKKHWIVKFPRGRHESDKKILRNEAEYMLLAKLLGLNVNELPHFKEDLLFIPRFDRIVVKNERTNIVKRLGLESLCSACGVSEFGHIFKLEDICRAIFNYSTNAFEDILEFVFRDVLNFICGNTDNHARNSSLLKHTDSQIRLSPLYDFSPMYLDREGIVRLNKWKNFERNGTILINEIEEWLSLEFKFDKNQLRLKFKDFKESLTCLPELLLKTKIDEDIQIRIISSLDNFKKTFNS